LETLDLPMRDQCTVERVNERIQNEDGYVSKMVRNIAEKNYVKKLTNVYFFKAPSVIESN
jgi:predicted transcriptional regulator